MYCVHTRLLVEGGESQVAKCEHLTWSTPLFLRLVSELALGLIRFGEGLVFYNSDTEYSVQYLINSRVIILDTDLEYRNQNT